MSKKKENVPQKFSLGKSNLKKQDGAPTSGGGGGKIDINYPEVNWNRKKLTLTITALLIPYTAGMVISFAFGSKVMGGILLGLGVLVGGMYLLLRYIEKSDF